MKLLDEKYVTIWTGFVRFELLTAITIKVTVFGYVTPCISTTLHGITSQKTVSYMNRVGLAEDRDQWRVM
jgi:hypothetical protein